VVPRVEIELTCPASSTPLSASIDTVAGWPTLTLVMSASLKATVIDIVLVSTISANGVFEEAPAWEELPPPEPLVPAALLLAAEALLLPPAPPDAAPPGPAPPLAALALAAVPLAPADTVSSGERLASETIVPLAGA
jgi:hypothetical protein